MYEITSSKCCQSQLTAIIACLLLKFIADEGNERDTGRQQNGDVTVSFNLFGAIRILFVATSTFIISLGVNTYNYIMNGMSCHYNFDQSLTNILQILGSPDSSECLMRGTECYVNGVSLGSCCSGLSCQDIEGAVCLDDTATTTTTTTTSTTTTITTSTTTTTTTTTSTAVTTEGITVKSRENNLNLYNYLSFFVISPFISYVRQRLILLVLL